jgi:NDP-4-keto-2,6-dideoxyhexose 3-C-methyltransferase
MVCIRAIAAACLDTTSALAEVKMYRAISQCRICGNTQLVEVLDLGIQVLTGVFPRVSSQHVTSGPLRLVKCFGGEDECGLLQLQHTYDLGELYGDNYGYRSGLNTSMIDHLQGKVRKILSIASPPAGSLIIDIGANDGTTLRSYPADRYTLVGIDPAAAKFKDCYPSHIDLIPDFFSQETVRAHYGDRRATVITSFSMFYDLEDPLRFMREVSGVLDEQGIWVLEQSYMPTMLRMNSYDTVCHEHLEYYALKQIKWMADRCGLRIIDVEFNAINGGSFSIVIAHRASRFPESPLVAKILGDEMELGLDGLHPYQEFAERVAESKAALRSLLHEAKERNKSVAALGASTKGNVLLQYCNVTETDIRCIGEVNADKFGCVTPGTHIPIVPEEDVLASRPDYLLVLPWHFRPFFMEHPKFNGLNLVFPLPELEILRRSDASSTTQDRRVEAHRYSHGSL